MSKEKQADVAALLRARCPLIWIVSREEARVEGAVFEAAASARYLSRSWDVGQGVTEMSGRLVPIASADPGDMLRTIGERATRGSERCVWIMRDLAPWITGPIGMATCRQLRNLARMLPTVPHESSQAIVILSTTADVPAELTNHCTVIDWPLPGRGEIAAILDAATLRTIREGRAAFLDLSDPEEIRDATVEGRAIDLDPGVQVERSSVGAPVIDLEDGPVVLREAGPVAQFGFEL